MANTMKSCPAEHIRSRDATLRWRCGSNLSTKGLRDRARNVLPFFLSFDPRRGRTDEGAAAATKYAPQQRRVSTLGMRTKIRRGKDGEGGREGRRGGREMSLFSNVDLLASPMKRMDGASLKSQESHVPFRGVTHKASGCRMLYSTVDSIFGTYNQTPPPVRQARGND